MFPLGLWRNGSPAGAGFSFCEAGGRLGRLRPVFHDSPEQGFDHLIERARGTVWWRMRRMLGRGTWSLGIQ